MLHNLIPLVFVIATDGAQTWISWPNTPPKSIPFAKSTDILDWEYLNVTGNIQYDGAFQGADTWYPSFKQTNDGSLMIYTPWTDGTIYFTDNTSISAASYLAPVTTTGYALFRGTNVTNLVLQKNGTGIYSQGTTPYSSRYPSANVYYNNTWFYGTYVTNAVRDHCIWYYMCPFIGFRWSLDDGKTWTEPRWNISSQMDNIFAETCIVNGVYKPIKFGSPHVVDFGENLKYSSDGKMYLIAHGSNINDSIVSWMQGDQIYIARVKPTIYDINNTQSWEFYNGDVSTNKWSNNSVDNAQPLFTWVNKTGCVTMTYFNVLKKYIIAISTPNNERNTTEPFDTYFLESDNIDGPYKYIVYMSTFGPQAYFVNFPSEFLPDKIIKDNVAGDYYYESYLSYSNDWNVYGGDKSINITKPYGGGYHWSLQRSRFKLSTTFVNKLLKPAN